MRACVYVYMLVHESGDGIQVMIDPLPLACEKVSLSVDSWDEGAAGASACVRVGVAPTMEALNVGCLQNKLPSMPAIHLHAIV